MKINIEVDTNSGQISFPQSKTTDLYDAAVMFLDYVRDLRNRGVLEVEATKE